jgi:hypothetical protein
MIFGMPDWRSKSPRRCRASNPRQSAQRDASAERVRLTRLSCRIVELGEFVHEPCSDAKQKGAQGPFFWHWRSSRTVSINGLGSKGGENYPAEQLQLKGVLRPCFVCIPCDTVEL